MRALLSKQHLTSQHTGREHPKRWATKARTRPVAMAAVVLALAMVASCSPSGGGGGSTPTTTVVPITVAPGSHGELLSATQTAIVVGHDAPVAKAWHITYRSTDSHGVSNVVSGTVLVPSKQWTSGFRPLVAYAPGTHGLAQGCQPSAQLAAGTDYEAANIAAILKRNWAVVVTDYAGYLPGESPSYLAGRSQGHAVLDAVTASFQLAGSGISSTTRTGIWGYSQGGQSAAWAGELQPSYSPGINLRGVAAGGVPADFRSSASNLNASTGASFAAAGIAGLAQEYPDDIPLDELANAAGDAALADLGNKCVFEALFDYMNRDIADFTVGGATLEELFERPTIGNVVDAQSLPNQRIAAPLYMYHGQADEFLDIGQAYAAKQAYCALGTNVRFELYASEHIVTQFQAAPKVTDWLNARFGTAAAQGNCNASKPAPASTAEPGGGDFVVGLDQWPLHAVMYVGGLYQWLHMPAASRLNADANLTSNELNGSITIPRFITPVKIFGFDVSVGLTLNLTPAQATVSVDDDGQLHVHGSTTAVISIDSIGFEPLIAIPFGCRTSSAVQFPLDFDGPVSALGDGTLTFTGRTSFPSLTGCGIFDGALGLLFSGPDNHYRFTVSPPVPTAY